MQVLQLAEVHAEAGDDGRGIFSASARSRRPSGVRVTQRARSSRLLRSRWM
ncbi:hypothetical protein ACFSTC_26050 [Nonomuraea ferruginea]